MDLTVVIPFYNEEEKLNSCLETVSQFLSQRLGPGKFEILAVNDGSRDKSLEIAQQFAQNYSHLKVISEDINHGKGYAVKKGMLLAQGETVCFLDVDLSTPVEELENFLPYYRKEYDIVIGTRRVKESKVKVHQPFYREFLGVVFYYLTRLFLGIKVSDITCGFKCYSQNAARLIFSKQTLHDWSYDAEDLFLAQKYRLKVQEVPVVWRNRSQSRVRILKDAVESLKGLIKIRLNDLVGIYDL